MRMLSAIPKSRMIFKVLVLGRDLQLQTGFLNLVSGERVTNQLYNTLGVSLGIASNEEHSDFSTILQLWSLPLDERLNGITKTFTKGHRGVIAVVKPDELEELQDLLQSFSVIPGPDLIVAIVGDVQGIETELLQRLRFIKGNLEIHSIDHANDVINILCNRLRNKRHWENESISVVFLDEEQCPIFEPRELAKKEPQCTEEEIDEIRSILINQGLRVIEDSCLVELAEGTAWISLRTGAVRLEPAICAYCSHDCKRQTNICIIAVDSGWSSRNMGDRALLTTAKIIALSDRTLPGHVEMQICRATSCAQFVLEPGLLEDEITSELIQGKTSKAYIRKTLLEVASDRVSQGRLPQTAYNMLKRRLKSFQKSANM